MHIAHPEEILQPVDDDYNLLILKGGEVGYMCHKMNSCLNDQVVNRIKRAEKDNPFLINLHFITKQRPNFEVKSLVYSIIYFLDYDKLIAILKDTQLDFEMYSFLKDKNKNVVDEFEVIPCEHCTTRHTKFSCHRLHYIPLEQHLITKNLVLEKKAKNKRNPNIPRISSHRYSTLLKFQGSRIGATLAEMNSL